MLYNSLVCFGANIAFVLIICVFCESDLLTHLQILYEILVVMVSKLNDLQQCKASTKQKALAFSRYNQYHKFWNSFLRVARSCKNGERYTHFLECF